MQGKKMKRNAFFKCYSELAIHDWCFTAVKLHSIGLLILIGFSNLDLVYFHSAQLNSFFNQAHSIYLFIFIYNWLNIKYT